MTTVPTPRPGPVEPEVTPLIAGSQGGRRRRPSGEPPPLPRHIDHSIRWYLALGGLAGALWVAMSVPVALGVITRADLVILHAVAAARTAWLTRLMLDVNALASPWTVQLVAWATIAVLVAFRRFRHLAAYLVIVLAAALLISVMTLQIGRMRPAGIQILGPWQGYSQPSRPVATLALALAGVLYTLVPAGRWRNRGKWAAAIVIAALCAADCAAMIVGDQRGDAVQHGLVGGQVPGMARR